MRKRKRSTGHTGQPVEVSSAITQSALQQHLDKAIQEWSCMLGTRGECHGLSLKIQIWLVSVGNPRSFRMLLDIWSYWDRDKTPASRRSVWKTFVEKLCLPYHSHSVSIVRTGHGLERLFTVSILFLSSLYRSQSECLFTTPILCLVCIRHVNFVLPPCFSAPILCWNASVDFSSWKTVRFRCPGSWTFQIGL